MRTYTIKRWTGNWEDVPSLDMDKRYHETPANVFARAQIAYDDENIYVRLETEEYEHRNVEMPPYGLPCEDSCLEFFFAPVEGDRRYFNIEINSNSCIYFGIGHSIKDLIRLIPDEHREILFPKIKMKEGGWSVEFVITADLIKIFFPQYTIYSGKKIRANCFKCADKTTPPHYLSWNHLTLGEPSFHDIECFGEMIFE